MKVKELIEQLKEKQEEYGNIEVTIIVEDIDGTKTGIVPINEINVSKDEDGSNPEIYIGYFGENN